MVPRIVLVDPELAVSVPPHITAWTGMDAITQLIESLISRRATPVTDAVALHGLELAGPNLLDAYRNGSSRSAREGMSHAALLSGIALANSGLGMAHGVAAALGVHCRVAHGLACAVMLPAALRVNNLEKETERKLAEAAGGMLGPVNALDLVPSTSPRSLEEISQERQRERAQLVIMRINALVDELKIPRRLSEIGKKASRFRFSSATSCKWQQQHERQLREPDAELTQILDRDAMILAAGFSPAWQQICRPRCTGSWRSQPGPRSPLESASGKVLNVGSCPPMSCRPLPPS